MSQPKAYQLLDSGRGRKLEDMGGYRLERQAATAFWNPHLGAEDWKKIEALHHRSDKGGGHWEFKTKLPESWLVTHGGLTLKCKLTAFGHAGFFAEQASEWQWFQESAVLAKQQGHKLKVLNLFAYTGGSSVALSLGGGDVTHVDAAKNIVDWAKENAKHNGCPENSIRFIVDDCIAFLKREKRRGNIYDGVIFDPPSYGRGPNKEVFKLEDDIGDLMTSIRDVLSATPKLLHFSCHTPGFSPVVLGNILHDYFTLDETKIERGEMLVHSADGRALPSGNFCRFRSL